MKNEHCMGRLLASATHDMRNVLAVIRESAGLSADMMAMASDARTFAYAEKLAEAMREIQQQVIHGAALSDGLEFLAQCGVHEGDAERAPCDLTRAARHFCLMMTRRAKAGQINLDCVDADEPIWTETPALDIWASLLQLLDLCTSVGGKVDLRLSAGTVSKQEGIIIEVMGGENRDLVLSAMMSSSLLSDPLKPGWRARLTPWRDRGERFFLSVHGEME